MDTTKYNAELQSLAERICAEPGQPFDPVEREAYSLVLLGATLLQRFSDPKRTPAELLVFLDWTMGKVRVTHGNLAVLRKAVRRGATMPSG